MTQSIFGMTCSRLVDAPRQTAPTLTVAIAVCAILSAARPIHAADVQGSERSNVNVDAIEEIVVTAQKRGYGETLQNVPLSITAFSATELDNRAITSFIDYGTTVPNLAFGTTGDGALNSRSVSIRGVAGGSGSTGFYIDDTPVPDSMDPHIVDIQRIEVLRGPQGTLYGARSMGGTVRLITNQPDFDKDSGLVKESGSYTDGADKGNYSADGVVNVPIVQGHVALRMEGFREDDAGWFKREFPSATDPTQTTVLDNIAAQSIYGGSIALAVKPSDDLTITQRVMTQHTSINGFPYSDYTLAPGTNPPLTPSNFVQSRPYDVAEGGYDKWNLISFTVNYKAPFGEFVSSSSYFNRDTFQTEDTTPFNQFLLNTYVPGTTAGPAPLSVDYGVESYTQEFRFSSDLPGPLQFVSGAYYSSTKNSRTYPPAFTPGFPFGDEEYAYYQASKTTEPAVFGELTYQITDKWKATGGLRAYRIDTDAYPGYQEGWAATSDGSRIVFPAQSESDKGVNPKAELEYHITSDKMVYANAAKGFRPGGVGSGVPVSTATSCASYLDSLGLTSDETRHYNSDSLWSYELGGKTGWLDHRLTVDGAAYFIDWKNIQQTIHASCGFSYIANAGAAQIKGGEIELNARPINELNVSLGMGYADAKITQVGITSPQPVGSTLAEVPNWTGNASATYTTPINGEINWVTNGTYAYVGRSYSITNNTTTPRERPSYRLLDLRSGLSWSNFNVAIVGKNLGNEHADLSDSNSIAAENPGHPRIVTNQPRTIGVEFETKW